MSDTEHEPDVASTTFDLDLEEDEPKKKSKSAKRKVNPNASESLPGSQRLKIPSIVDSGEGSLYAKTLNVKDFAAAMTGLSSVDGCDFIFIRFSPAGMELNAHGGMGSLTGQAFFGRTAAETEATDACATTGAFTPDYRCDLPTIDTWASVAEIKDLQRVLKGWEMVVITHVEKDGVVGLRFTGLCPFDVGGSDFVHFNLEGYDNNNLTPQEAPRDLGWTLEVSANKLTTMYSQISRKEMTHIEMTIDGSKLQLASANEQGVVRTNTQCDIDKPPVNMQICPFVFPAKYFKLVVGTLGKFSHAMINISFNVNPSPDQSQSVLFCFYFDNAQPRSYLQFWI